VHKEKEPYSISRKNDLIDSMNTKSYILMNAVKTVIQIHCNSKTLPIHVIGFS
jgi:hypothetical protein